MSFFESLQTALFCFGMVVTVLALLYGLIKLFSLIINIKKPNFKNIINRKKDKKPKENQIQKLDIKDKNTDLYATVTDEQGNSKVFRFASIKSLEENKK